MKKIAIINPPAPFLIDQRVFPNVGLIRVATQLKKDGHDIQVFDLSGNDNYLENMRSIKGDFSHYLISSTTPQFQYAYKIAEELKGGGHLILGGAHASAIGSLRSKGIEDDNIETLNIFDTVFEGEGEDTRNIFKNGWQKGALIKNLDDLDIPNRDLIDTLSYKYMLNGKLTTSIQTQRGCPFQCAFCCGRDIEMYNRTRSNSPDRILEEMDLLNKKYGYASFMWYDDEINVNPKRLEELCKKLSTRNYQHRGFIRSDLILRYPETVQMLKDAGFVKLCAGVESGSDKILKNINKGVTAEENLKARKIIGDVGIHYESFLMIGLPGETKKDVEKTVQWIKDAKPDDFDINIMVPYPGSVIYDKAILSTKYKDYKWEYNGLYFNKPDYSKDASYYKGLGGRAIVDSRTDDMTAEYLKQKREEIQCMK